MLIISGWEMEVDMEKSVKEKVKMSSRLWLGGADCSITALCNIVTGGGLTFFFVNYFGMDVKWSALCWLLFGIWNALNDPLFGYISDRTKFRLGRRIPYIRYGALAIAVVFVLSWVVFFDTGSNVQMFAQMFVSLFLFDMLYTAIATSLYVMPFEMAVTNEARSKIMLVKVIFGLVALSVPLVLLAQLEGILNRSLKQFQLTMTIIGVAAGVIMFLSTFFYKENSYVKEEEQYPFFKSVATCFKNKNFIVFETISFSVTYIQTALMMGLSYYFGSCNVNYLYSYIAMFGGIVTGIILWMKPGAKWGVKRCIVIMCSVFCLALLCLLALGQYTLGSILGFFGAGIGFAGGTYLVPMMNGDVIDYDEHLSGLRREGMYAGVNSLICKPAISIANAIFPIMLQWFGYDSSLPLASQSSLAVFGIRFSWVSISALLLLICAVLIGKFYALDGSKWASIKADLALAHEQKQRAYEEQVLGK